MASVRAKLLIGLGAAWLAVSPAHAGWPSIFPEQREIGVRHPSQLPHLALPETPLPPTVTAPRFDAPPWDLSLDEAIRIALGNSEVVRVLAGVTAANSGRSIYDAAISNAAIDVANAAFDPVATVQNSWFRTETPFAFEDPGDPDRTLLGGSRTDGYNVDFELSKENLFGGTWALGVNDDTSRFQPGIPLLSPRNTTALDLSFTQPLLQGGGRAANLAPIVLARIDTERSYFQFKSSMQELVRGVIEAYWSLVFARTDLWAREQQVKQAEFALQQSENNARVNLISRAEVAQSRVALANFKSTLIGSQANVLQREAALRNILGLPPYEPTRIRPVTPPATERLEFDWELLVSLAEQYRPELIELKLILEADQQLLLQARNQALPQLNAVGLYRWNGLEGVMPVGDAVSSSLGRNNDWTLGVNFSVPLGLRQARAQLRQRELLIARDRANLVQGLHSTTHLLALDLRNLDQFYEQYLATLETRAAARVNLDFQFARYRAELSQFINVLQAIVDWGNSVSSAAQLLTQYNTELANLQVETGTILETHDIYFYEERYRSLGPLVHCDVTACYPRAKRPTDNGDVYPVEDEAAEEFFDLDDPLANRPRERRTEELPPLPPLLPPAPLNP